MSIFPYSATGAFGLPMCAETKHETWRDWILPGFPAPDDASLITRDEIFDTLQRWGVEVDIDDLRNWQRQGVIPYGERVWHKETGRTRTVYAPWMPHVLAELRALQAKGTRLQDMKVDLMATAILLSGPRPGDTFTIDLGDLEPALEAIAVAYERYLGRPVVNVEARLGRDPATGRRQLVVQVLDDGGARFTYPPNISL